MPQPTDLYSSPSTSSFASTWVDADAIKTSVATVASAVSYSGAALNGAVGAGAITPTKTISVTSSVSAATYNTTDPIVITGTNERGEVITDSLLLTAAGGNETIGGKHAFKTVTKIDVPAQLGTGGAFTFGILDL